MSTSPDLPDSPLQLLFLGTGTSTGLPLTPCLTLTQPYPAEFSKHLPLPAPTAHPSKGEYNPSGEWPDTIPCACCRAAVSPDVPEGWKNKRGNTSVIVRKKRYAGDDDEEGEWRNVIVDVGKTFREQSAKFFPRWGVTRIDAVILTHGHADAYYGLDDLREWCFRQNCTIPVFLNRETYETVGASFPYLVDRKKASGGGDVPALRFHIIEDDADFEAEGIRVRALPVEHGIYFRDDHREPLICLGFMFDESIIYMSDVSEIPETTWLRMMDRTTPPLSAMTTFNKNNISEQPEQTDSPNRVKDDPSAAPPLKTKVVIPPTPEDTPRHSRRNSRRNSPDLSSLSMTHTPSNSSATSASGSASGSQPRPFPVLIIDSLWPLVRHSSHIHMVEALRIAMRLKPSITYLVDLVHPVSHYMWEELCASVRGEHGDSWTGSGEGRHPDDEQAQELVARYWADKDVKVTKDKVMKWGGRVEPGWDGLIVEVNGDGGVEGEGYEIMKGKGGSGPGLAM